MVVVAAYSFFSAPAAELAPRQTSSCWWPITGGRPAGPSRSGWTYKRRRKWSRSKTEPGSPG